MKMFIPLMCLVSLALAEPPVGDGYPGARSSHDDNHHDHHASDHQRSLSQEYGPPSDSFASARNGPSSGYEYNPPNARSSANARGSSQFPPATVRVSFNQRFGSPSGRSSGQDHNALDARNSQEYAGPNARSGISQEYGPPAARSLSQEYGVPSVVSARSLSTEYGVPNARSSPSEEYGAPAVVAARSNQKHHSPASNFRSAQPARGFSQDHSTPSARSQFSDSQSHGHSIASARSNDGTQGYDTPRPFSKSGFASRSAPSSTYGAPSSRSLSTSYGAPSARGSDSYSEDYNQKDLSETYGAPSARGLSQEYGVPSSRSNQNTNAIASSYAAPRSAPSSTYLPASRNAAPSEQYGVPEQRDGASQGYDNARARALDELLSQEPANYDFAYQIEDYESGSDFGHAETRQADRAEGSYFVVLPDGTRQTVEYEADEGGFKPRISVEPADLSARSGGYDENAADIVAARSAEGPY